MKLKGFVFDDNGVAGIVAALIPNHHIHVLGQQIDDFALAFVAPLSPDYHRYRHACTP